MSLVELGAGCVLLWSASTLEATPAGWIEKSELDLLATAEGCPRVRIPLPDAVEFDAEKGIERLGDGTRRKLPEQAWEVQASALSGNAVVVVHLPDLRGGDQATLAFTRTWNRTDSFTWRPPAGARLSHLYSVEPGVMEGEVEQTPRGWTVTEASGADGVTLSAPGHAPWTSPHADLLPPSLAPEVTRFLEIRVPSGDPLVSLYPGGGSSVKQTLELSFEAEDRDRGWLVPMSTDRWDLQIGMGPGDDVAEWTERRDGVLLRVFASEAPARVTLIWEEANAPTHGRPEGDERLSVDAPGGLVAEDRQDSWFLAGIHERPVVPNRDALIKALGRRYRVAALPEPGLPNSLRGGTPGWELAALIPDAIAERAEVVAWPSDPLWPRKLNKARRSGALTPAEAGLITWLYANQAGLRASWALVHPATDGPGGTVSLAGYTDLLVRLYHEDEQRWMDLGCEVCAPFEVRPELLGATAIGPGVDKTPEPPEGQWTVVWGPDWARWDLRGTAALQLRRWLHPIAASETWEALATRIAGPGAEMVEVEGVDELGAEIQVATRGGRGIAADPLSLPVPDDDDTLWVSWTGTRELVHIGRTAPEVQLESGALHYWRGMADGHLVERLTVHNRQIAGADARAVSTARQFEESTDEAQTGLGSENAEPPAADH